MPSLNGILETVLYVDNLERARAFYEALFALSSVYSDQRMCAYDVAGEVCCCFSAGESRSTPCNCPAAPFRRMTDRGPVHIAFAIGASEIESGKRGWTRSALASKGGPNSPGAEPASISGIPTGICWNWPPRGCGKAIDCRLAGSTARAIAARSARHRQFRIRPRGAAGKSRQ